MRNKFVNDFKLEIRLYLSVSEIIHTAIDIMNSIRFSTYYIIVSNFKCKLTNKYLLNIRNFFLNI